MSSAIWCAIFPAVFFMLSGVMFSGSADTVQLDRTKEAIFCAYPDYFLGGNHTGNDFEGCLDQPAYNNRTFVIWEADLNFFDANTTSNWVAEIPTGWIDYTADVISVSITKFGALIYYIPALLFTYTVPAELTALEGALPLVAIGYLSLWAVEFYGLYKSISPFTGGH